MKVIDILRLLRKHLVILLLTPIFLAGMVTFLTKDTNYSYSSETTLYTGIASGSSIELDKSFSYFANNTAFDNLINVINSRETQQGVAIRLLAQHLMLEDYDPKYISRESFTALHQITPPYIFKLVVRNNGITSPDYKNEEMVLQGGQSATNAVKRKQFRSHTVKTNESLASISVKYGVSEGQIIASNHLINNALKTGQILKIDKFKLDDDAEKLNLVEISLVDSVTLAENFSFNSLDTTSAGDKLPFSINKKDYEQTVSNLQTLMTSSDTNFIYKLLYFNHPHYSIKAISSVSVQRIASSDLVKLKYDSDDPGICQQTLILMSEACMSNYKLIKEKRSDAVVKYFEHQLKQAAARLKIGEDKLLKFNEDNNIINYYEQSKAVAVVKEDLDMEFNNKKIKLAGTLAAIKRIEEKLDIQKQIQLKSASIIDKRNILGEVNSQIATAEIIGFTKDTNEEQLAELRQSSDILKAEIRSAVNDLYSFGNTTDGLPVKSLLNDWISNVIEYEDTKAGLEVLKDRIKEYQKQYAIYAPAGANIKRIEREISVSEQEFLEILHGLNLAKLKNQDAELSSTIKAVDPPFFPLSPNPTKRKILILAAALIGFILVLSIILATEYFDDTLKNAEKSSKIIQLQTLGVFPKVLLKTGSLNFPFVTNRLLEMIIQQFDLLTLQKAPSVKPKTLLFFSSLSNEGKTVLAGNIAWKLKKQGKKVLYLNFSRSSLRETETSQIGYPQGNQEVSTSGSINSNWSFRLVGRMMGYGDNRIDSSSPFLQKPENNLESSEYKEYHVNAGYFTTDSYEDMIKRNGISIDFAPDLVIIELPPILYYSYPPQLIASADLAVLVCRANRIWSSADQGALNILKKNANQAPAILLNGVDIEVVESYLGDLPKKRSQLRRLIKNIVRFQFYSRYQP